MKTTARKLDIVLRSATGLKKVSSSRMAAYAVAWIQPSLRVPSPLDKRHGRNPEWNTTISITLDDRTMSQAGLQLHIELLGQGLVSTKPIGFVTVDMTDIFQKGSEGDAVRAPFHEYPVRRRSGRQQGTLNFELCLQGSTSRHAPTKQQEELHVAEKDAFPVPLREQYYQRESVSMAPPLPLREQYYQRESESMAPPPPLREQYYQSDSADTKMEKSSSTSQFSRRNGSRRGGRGYGFTMPMATSVSRDLVTKQDELSLLHSSY